MFKRVEQPGFAGLVANDGLGILRSFSLPDQYFADRIRYPEDRNEQRWTPYDDR